MASVILLSLAALPSLAAPSARIEVPEPGGWTGQRIPFFIELRAGGSFTGAASFDIPDVPNTIVLKVGNPVLGSLTEGDAEVFTQRHEFALFSQADGPLTLPAVTARFSHRRGYTGPSFDASIKTEPSNIIIRRPPGSEAFGFLVTTPGLEIEESWDPAPGPLETGAVLKRTIIQRAAQVTGMALAPIPTDAPGGIRVYPGDPVVIDKTERGDFIGERSETTTYLVREPGLHTLPAIRYDWWNPEKEKLESRTLPAVTFTATAPPAPPEPASPAGLLWALAALIGMGMVWYFRKPLGVLIRNAYDLVDPPARRAARAFLGSCRRNDAAAAARGWASWQILNPRSSQSVDLQHQIIELHRHLYASSTLANEWNGRALAAAFRANQAGSPGSPKPSPLPRLNS